MRNQRRDSGHFQQTRYPLEVVDRQFNYQAKIRVGLGPGALRVAAPRPRTPVAGAQRRGLRSAAAVGVSTSDDNAERTTPSSADGFMARFLYSACAIMSDLKRDPVMRNKCEQKSLRVFSEPGELHGGPATQGLRVRGDPLGIRENFSSGA